MSARLFAFGVWALVGLSVAFWALRLLVRAPQAPAYTLAVDDAAAVRGDLSRLLGVPPVAPTLAAAAPDIGSRFRLTGVMAPKTPAARGVALIAVDGKLPRAFHVGAKVDGELTLQSVSLRSASIGPAQGSASVVLELPAPTPPATGTLPSAAPPVLPSAAAPALPVPHSSLGPRRGLKPEFVQ